MPPLHSQYQGYQKRLMLELKQLAFQFHSLSQLHSQYQSFEKHLVLQLSQLEFQLRTLSQLHSQHQALQKQLIIRPRQQGFEEQLKLELRQLAFQFHILSSLHSLYYTTQVLCIWNQSHGPCSDRAQNDHFGSCDKIHVSYLTLTTYLLTMSFIWWIFREWFIVSTFVPGRFLGIYVNSRIVWHSSIVRNSEQ